MCWHWYWGWKELNLNHNTTFEFIWKTKLTLRLIIHGKVPKVNHPDQRWTNEIILTHKQRLLKVTRKERIALYWKMHLTTFRKSRGKILLSETWFSSFCYCVIHINLVKPPETCISMPIFKQAFRPLTFQQYLLKLKSYFSTSNCFLHRDFHFCKKLPWCMTNA